MNNTIACLFSGLFAFSGIPVFSQELSTRPVVHGSGAEGYYFLHSYRINIDYRNHSSWQLILNERGEVIYYRETPKASDFKLHPNGMMSFFSNDKFFIMNHDFMIVDSVSCVGDYLTDPHDFLVLRNGHYLLLGTEQREEDLSQLCIFKNKQSAGSRKAKVLTGVIQELNSKKELLHLWRAREHFRLEDVAEQYLQDTQRVDITHFNSLEYCSDGSLMVSARYFNEVFRISWPEGSMLWRLGGPYSNMRILNDNVPFLGQHDAREIAQGRITLFDNGFTGPGCGHGARAVEYLIDTAAKTAKLMWSYSYDSSLVSEATGNMQRMADGNTLINFGKVRKGIPNITFVVVDSAKSLLLEMSFADTIGTYRTRGYEKLPENYKFPKISAKRSGKSWILTAEKADSYRWSTGEISRRIKVSSAGKYFVYVSRPHGGFLRSEPVELK